MRRRLPWHSQSIPNHIEGVRDIKLGWRDKIFRSALLTMGAVITQKACVVVDKVDLVELKVEVVDARLAATNGALYDLKEDIKARVARADELHDSFLTKEEFDRVMRPELAPQRRDR